MRRWGEIFAEIGKEWAADDDESVRQVAAMYRATGRVLTSSHVLEERPARTVRAERWTLHARLPAPEDQREHEASQRIEWAEIYKAIGDVVKP